MTAAPSAETTDVPSLLETYHSYCVRHQLAFQVTDDGKAVFFPRVIAPGSGGRLTWRVSEGKGTVYSSTVIYRRNVEPYTVALIDLDEGFRMMSRVEADDPLGVGIGDRVFVRFKEGEDSEPPLPVFVRMEDGHDNI